MSKYINADELKDRITAQFGTRYEMSCFDIVSTIMDMPSADVVEVGLLCEKIKADIEEAKESFSDCENETDKSFQQGRIFAHNYDLFVIERMLKNDGERKETE